MQCHLQIRRDGSRMTSSEGLRMWHQAGARAMHRKLRAEGRVPGAEGRQQIAINREKHKQEKLAERIRQLSGVFSGQRGSDGLTAERREANRLILERAGEEEKARVERLRQERLARQKRLASVRFPC